MVHIKLLADHSKLASRSAWLLWVIHLNIIQLDCIAGVEAYDTPCFDQVLIKQAIQHNLGVVKKLLGFLTDALIIKDLRISPIRVLSTDLPSREEWIPVDIRKHLPQIEVVKDSCAEEGWLGDRDLLPVSFHALSSSLSE